MFDRKVAITAFELGQQAMRVISDNWDEWEMEDHIQQYGSKVSFDELSEEVNSIRFNKEV